MNIRIKKRGTRKSPPKWEKWSWEKSWDGTTKRTEWWHENNNTKWIRWGTTDRYERIQGDINENKCNQKIKMME